MLSVLHYAPSAAAGALAIYLALLSGKVAHKLIYYAAVALAVLGFYGFVTSDVSTLFVFGFHAVHGWVGAVALTLMIASAMLGGKRRLHCTVGRWAGVFSAVSLTMGVVILIGLSPVTVPTRIVQVPVSSVLPGVEAVSFMNVSLTPIVEQLNNAIEGTQSIDEASYRLKVTGLVVREEQYTYGELLGLPAYAEVVPLDCVEGWSFTAKWTGFRVEDLLVEAEPKVSGSYVEFICADGYTTALPMSYLISNNTLLAYGLNDVRLPADRGFPLQLVAGGKYGYKWAKWVVEVRVVAGPVRGYWESRGYSDTADVGSFPFG